MPIRLAPVCPLHLIQRALDFPETVLESQRLFPNETACARHLDSWGIRITTIGKEVLDEILSISPILTTCGVPRDSIALDQARLSVEPVWVNYSIRQ